MSFGVYMSWPILVRLVTSAPLLQAKPRHSQSSKLRSSTVHLANA